jgi:phosphoglycolate phosphatase-like HAD superfamily hydrolase
VIVDTFDHWLEIVRAAHRETGWGRRPTREDFETTESITFDVPPEETFMIGDAISDIRQGKRAGVRTIAAAWGFQRRDFLLAEAPDFMADEPADLLEILM